MLSVVADASVQAELRMGLDELARGGLVSRSQWQRQDAHPAVEELVDRAQAEPVTDRLQTHRVIAGRETSWAATSGCVEHVPSTDDPEHVASIENTD